MRWLVRLVTPPGGVVLDPFAGSGTTVEACIVEGARCIAVEREAAYLPLIVARLSKPIQPDLFGLGDSAVPPAPREAGNGRDGEASADRRYTERGGSSFAMKPGRRYREAGPVDADSAITDQLDLFGLNG
jgi:DNA methylase